MSIYVLEKNSSAICRRKGKTYEQRNSGGFTKHG